MFDFDQLVVLENPRIHVSRSEEYEDDYEDDDYEDEDCGEDGYCTYDEVLI